MKRSVGLWQLFGFAVTALLGTLLHFLYDLTGGSPFVAPFSAVNESTFEHMKILFWPMLLYALIEGVHFRDRLDFVCIKLRGIVLGLALIPILFYTYNGAIGKSPDFVNIAIFFIAAGAAYLVETKALLQPQKPCSRRLASVILLALALLFVVFTKNPPHLPLFQDPLTNSYGI